MSYLPTALRPVDRSTALAAAASAMPSASLSPSPSTEAGDAFDLSRSPQPNRYERQLSHKFLEAERLAALPGKGRDLYCALAILRRRLARDANVPAYQVLSNHVLLSLCEREPRDMLGLLAIPGLGQVRLKAYGAEILAVMRGILAISADLEQGPGDDRA